VSAGYPFIDNRQLAVRQLRRDNRFWQQELLTYVRGSKAVLDQSG